ncbi:MAG: ribonuclease III domain-containing protein [Methanoregula sp.]|nr:ribonuclease III domain-containing protein [Methanoregula sp.]
MEDSADSNTYLEKICYPTERYLIGHAVKNKERLISAMISNALLNEPAGFEQLSSIHADKSLETIGDFILDFVIIDNFATKDRYTAQQIDDFRQWYGNNENLQYFAKNCIHLHNYILWGPNERKQQIWDKPTTVILADRFEMLVAVIYLENGIDAVKEFLKKHHFFEEIDTLKER